MYIIATQVKFMIVVVVVAAVAVAEAQPPPLPSGATAETTPCIYIRTCCRLPLPYKYA